MRYIFFGTDDFSGAILEKLMSDFFFPQFVVTQPDKPVGRKQVLTPPKIKMICEDHQIPVVQTDNLQSIKDQLKEANPDVFIVASFGQIIPQDILDIPYTGAINVHTSLLPEYRGASPIQQAIIDGKKETGITIMLMDAKMDHGPILFQQPIDISDSETGPSLFNKLATVGGEVLAKCLPDILSGKIQPKKQDHAKATFTKIIKKADAEIDWSKSAQDIDRLVRAYDEWPVAWTKLPNGKRLKVYAVSLSDASGEPGELFVGNEKTTVYCGQNSLILEHVQVEGSKAISGTEFSRGYQKFSGQKLG